MATSCASLVALLLFMAAVVLSTRSSSSKSRQLRQFNAGSDAFYAGNSENHLADGSSDAGCENPNVSIVNGQMKCSSSSGCAVQCDRGYRTDGSRTQHLNCDSSTGNLTYLGKPWTSHLPPCTPHCKGGCPAGSDCMAPNKCKVSDCDPPCQNGGTCIIRDICNCPQGYAGLLCEDHYCAIPKPFPEQTTIGATTELTKMGIHCNSGYKMNNGLTSEFFKCQHHLWITLETGSTFENINSNCYE